MRPSDSRVPLLLRAFPTDFTTTPSMSLYLSIVRSFAGLLLALGGSVIFLYGLVAFAASKGSSPRVLERYSSVTAAP